MVQACTSSMPGAPGMKRIKQAWLQAVVAIMGAIAIAAPAFAAPAEDFPQREVHLMVPFPLGGPTDVIARLLAQGLDDHWPTPVVVENRPGAGTLVGTQYVSRAKPDGHTIGMSISAYTINPAIRPSMPYDTLADLTGVTQVAQANMVLVASPDAPFDTLEGLISYARENPGKLSYATPGPGTGTHMAGEFFTKEAEVDIMHVPYNGSGPALTDLLGGRVDIMFDILHSVRPHLEAERLQLLAFTSAERDKDFPETPVIAEFLPGFEIYSTIGLIAPSGTPDDITLRIQQDVADVLATDHIQTRFNELGLIPVGSTPDEWNAFIRAEIERWTELAQAANIRIE